MNRTFLRTALCAAVLAAGCDQLGLGPPRATSAPAEPPPAPVAIADLRPSVGEIFPAFASGVGARYSPEQLELAAADRARFWRAMANPAASDLVQGGGAEALVFRGCAETGCLEGYAVVAIDTATGAAFIGVRDAGGSEALVANERMEALLRLNSPGRAWDDPPAAGAATASAP
jgi:hypothetical protein